MSQKNRTELRKKDFLVVRQTKNQNIAKVITPQTFQVGLDDSEFQKSLVVKGNTQLSGRLLDGSGNAYVKGGGNVTVTEDTSGGLTISATLGTGATLSGAEADGIEDFTYDGSSTATIKVDLFDNAGIVKTSNGLALNISDVNSELSATPAADDMLFIYDTDAPTARLTKKITVNNLMSAASSLSTLGNPLTFRDGLTNTSYDNTSTQTIDITRASNGGLNIIGGGTSGGALYVDPNTATETTVLSSNSDFVLIYDASANSTRKIKPKYFANQSSDYSISAGTGLTYTAGSAYNGGANSTISVNTSVIPTLGQANSFSGNNTFSGRNTFGVSSTAGLTGSIQEVTAGVPYLVGGSNVTITTGSTGQITIAASMGAGGSLSNGSGIGTFSYNGSGNATVSLDATSLSSVSANRSHYVISADDSSPSSISRTTIAEVADSVDRTAIMGQGTGIDITFSGNSNPAVIATKLDSSTLSTDGSGNITVNKVPYALTGSLGIQTFIFDGSAARNINIDNSVVATLTGSQFSGDIGVTGSLGVNSSATFNQGITGSLQILPDGTPYLREGENITITSSSEGHITISASATSGGTPGGGNSDKSAEYLVLTATGSLSNERVFTSGVGINTSDGGSGNAYTVSIRNDVVATLTGSVFSGDIVAQSGLSGSLQMLSDGVTEYIIGTGGVSITTSSNGQLVVSGNAGKIYSAGTGLNLSSDIFSIDNSTVATLTGSVFSGNVVAQSGLSGSIQMLSDGATPYIIGTGSVSVTTSSSGQLVVSASDASSVVQQSGGSSFSNTTTFVFTGSTVTDNGGGSVTITPVIGAAEDSSYTDGLFTDLTYTTPIGTAVDRFNEVLKGLAPGAAPSLDDIDCSDSGTSAKLSFGSSQSISGYTNSEPSTLTPTDNLSDVDINGAFSATTTSNDVRVACFAGSTIIDGTLNADISADGTNYAADSFGNADQGTLKLFVNDNVTEVHSVDLSSFGSGNSLNGNGSGFNLSAATPGHFADGSDFATFQHRQGTYTITVADQREGWNYARVVHTIGGSDTTCNYVEWVNDATGAAVSMGSSGDALTGLSMTGTRNLSGAKYNTAGTAQYAITITNAYRNVYSTNQITFGGSNTSVAAQNIPAIDYAGGEDETKSISLAALTATITGDPILNGSISVNTNVPHPLKSNLSGVGTQSISGILLYDLSNTSTSTSETFRAENYRLKSGSYDTQASVVDAANTWDSTTSLNTVDGLLFYNSGLHAPVQGGVSGDFRNTADGGSITNGPSSNVNYDGITSGLRTFYRYFQNTSGGSKSNWSLTINGSGTIVSQGTALNSSRIHVLAKIPTTTSAFETGWMDLAVAFATGQTGDGDGCLDGALDSSLNATNSGTFGTQSVGANEYIVIKIEADAAWTGDISSMSISWS